MTQSTRSTRTTQYDGPRGPGGRRTAVAGPVLNLRLFATHTLPVFVRGFVSPRPRVVKAYAALNQPAWSAATLRALRERHGGAPVLVRGLSGPMLVLLDPQDVRQFYTEPVRALAMDPPDKNNALKVLEPTGVICSHGELREGRRRINDECLAESEAVHPSGKEFRAAVAEEARRLVSQRVVDMQDIRRAMARINRRIVLGDAAADDEQLHAWLVGLRNEANWMGRRRKQARAARAVYARAQARIESYAANAAAHTLIARALGQDDPQGDLDPVGQAHHWLLALDTLGPTAARTLLLLGAHPAEQQAVVPEAASGVADMPRMRACVKETVRLFPIVPDLLRLTRTETTWRGVPVPAGTAVLVPALFHQRDPDHVPAADLFAPGRWLSPGAHEAVQLAPFSHGGGHCPGENLALLVGAEFCAEILRTHRVTRGRPVLPSAGPLPSMLDSAAIRLGLEPR
ncbi:cytochrome P450 [Streptomyces sp. NPDC046876]|uniref:cytochrome P450 n=1 Tax=Streptomyces sp. NPDC046876 TaxID=3155616 RepID=UPI0033E1E953